jgi:vacuole membrane protein 1
VRLPAFAWGLGTAIGELPPFFAARAARLAGEEDAGHLDLLALAERAGRDGLQTLSWGERATVVSYWTMKRLGFAGIMLLASVGRPHPAAASVSPAWH